MCAAEAIPLITVIIAIIVVLWEIYKTYHRRDSLYTRLGGIYNIAAVIDKFSDRVLEDPMVGSQSPNQALREWHASARMPGLKWMRTLWAADVAGGPYRFVGTKAAGGCPFASRLNLSGAHASLHITSAEFDKVAEILSSTLDEFKVLPREKSEVLGAFAAHKRFIVHA